MLSNRDKWSLRIQRALAWACSLILYFFFWFLMFFIGRWRIQRKDEIRATFRRLVDEAKGPLIICSNHQTYIDSLLLIWAFGSPWFYFTHFRQFPWNLPKRVNFRSSWFMRISVYLGKCVPVEQGIPREGAKDTLKKIQYLLGKNESIMIFPEGRRSITGRIDEGNIGYGVGELTQATPNATIVCVYMRGNSQEKKSFTPKKGDHFYIDIRTVEPLTRSAGRRNARDIARQIMSTLVKMENKYLATPHKTWK